MDPTTGIDLMTLAREASDRSVEDFAQRFALGFFVSSAEGDAAPPLSQTASAARLTPRSAPWRVFPLRPRAGIQIVTVGRLDGNDVCVRDANVSKYHAFVRRSGMRFVIVDAGSRNGTRVNEQVVSRRGQGEPVELTQGCVVYVGGAVLTFLDAPAVHAFAQSMVRMARAA
jgi:hypothetical protein